MDREETRRILQHIEQVYPARFRGLGKAAAERMLELWEGVFRDVPMDVMQEAVHRFIRRNAKGYAPEAGELMVVVNEVSPVKYAEVVKPESNWMKVSPMGAEAIRRLIAEEGAMADAE